MAHFVKNDLNFHGARSKTRTSENRSSKKQDIASKNYGNNNDDGWGSVPQSSVGASNCDDGWGDIPQDSSASNNAWGQDRQVYGKAERNRRFRSHNSNSTFRVSNQSQPNWDDTCEEFPALGSKGTPVVNVWEKRKEKFEEIKAIEPTNQTEEERMIQKAIELSKMEVNHEEEKRRQLEEEYRLQMQLLEANPDMFEEFRLGEETHNAAADKFVTESYGACNGYAEELPNDEVDKDLIDHGCDWDYANEETITTKKDLKKENNKYESPKEEDSTPQLKQDSWSQLENTASRKSSYSGARPKISKVIDMFGGWGTAKPAATASYQDNVEDVPSNRSSKWDTVDIDFASRSSIRKNTTVKPINKLSDPDVPEVKIDNTFSNWDSTEAVTVSKLPTCDTAEAKTANISSWDTNQTETVTKLSTWDTVKTIDNSRNATLTVTPEMENCKVPSVETRRQGDVIKITSKDENCGIDSLDLEDSSKASDNVELNSDNYVNGYPLQRKEQKLVSQSEQKNFKPKTDVKTQSRSQFLLSEKDENETTALLDKEIISDLDDCQSFEMNKHEYQMNNSDQSQDISPKMSARQAEAKAKINSLEGKCFDSHSSVENDYAFLLKNIDSNYKSSTTQLEIANQQSKFETEDLLSRNNSSLIETEHLPGIPQLAKQTTSPFVLPEDAGCKDPLIPGPHPLYSNYKEASSLPSFGGFPAQVEYDLPMTRNGGSHIDPPKAPAPTPEMMNPVFVQQPMMTPLMNPTLMMGMNPMMMLNPFFVQQFQQMVMYYKSLGMSFEGGMPMYNQPMPLLNYANNPNPQVFGNFMGNVGPATEDGMIPSPVSTSASSPPGIDASYLFAENPSEVDQPDDNFWFQSFLSADSSSLIPPPKPTLVSVPENLPGVTTDSKISPTTFASLSLGETSICSEGNSPVSRNVSPIPTHQSYETSSRSPEVPYVTGWGDVNVDSKSNEVSGWCDDVDGWGSENASAARSMRNPSRHIAEKKTVCRQPTSRPNLGRSKT